MGSQDARLPVTSSSEPDWAPEARACYEDAIHSLLDQGVAFAVGGAFSVHTHTGIWRETKDLDLLLTPAEMPLALETLEARGFNTCVKDPVWLAKASRGDYFVDLITGIGNASRAVDTMWIERAAQETVLGIPCKVLGAEELIASKMFVAYRERFDGADVVHLVHACGRSLDWNRLLLLVGSHWELLYWSLVLFAYVYPAKTDRVPEQVWDQLTAWFRRSVRHPDKQAPFRGTLLDPRMFAIDVEERGERNLYAEYCDRYPWLIETHNPGGSHSL